MIESYLSEMWLEVWRNTSLLQVPFVEKIIRPIVVYLFLVMLLRFFGKRELAQLNPFDLVVLLCLSNTVQNAMIGTDETLLGGLISATTLLTFNYMVVRFLFRHRRWDRAFSGASTVLIEGGKVRDAGLAREALSMEELTVVAHRQGFANLDEVEYCALEPGGTFYMRRQQPPQAALDHAELMKRLDDLSLQLKALQDAKPTPRSG